MEYQSPGVYVEEVDTGPRPITAVPTSIAGFVGVTRRGPSSGKPELVTSFGDYRRRFGGFVPEPIDPVLRNRWANDRDEGGRFWLLPQAVQGFFENGGSQLWVKRAVANGATAASGDIGTGYAIPIVEDVAAGSNDLELAHLFGVFSGLTFNIIDDSGTVVEGQNGPDFQVTTYDNASRTVSMNDALQEAIQAGHAWAVPSSKPDNGPIAAPAGNQTTLRFRARDVGAWANGVTSGPHAGRGVSVDVQSMIGATLVALSTQAPAASSQVAVAAAAGAPQISVDEVIGEFEADPSPTYSIRVDGERYRVSSATGGGGPPVTLTLSRPLQTQAAASTTVVKLRSADVGTGQTQVVGVTDGTTFVVNELPGRLVAGTPAGVSLRIGNQTVETTAAAAATANPGEVEVVVVPPLNPAPTVGDDVDLLSSNIRLANASRRLYDGAIVELDNGTNKDIVTVRSTTGDLVTFDDPLQHSYLEGDLARSLEARVVVDFTAETGETAIETFENLRLVSNDPNNVENRINGVSEYVDVEDVAVVATDYAVFPTNPALGPLALAGGDDRHDALRPEDFVGVDGGSGQRTGIQALEDIDEIAICAVPAIWSQTVRNALIGHCERLRYRFAIVDSPDELSIADIRAFREPIDTRFAALYYPWLGVRDPTTGTAIVAAPSGHMAGVYAGVDKARGVHKAPANEVVRGIQGFNQDITKREQDTLNPFNINAFRVFPNRGNRVWGARTLSSDTTWRYINVRRLFIMVERSLDLGTQFVVFEPNTDPTWARVRQSIRNFLVQVWRTGALQGLTEDEAFFVECGLGTTMTQADIDAGQLIVEVGIAPAKPAEFVIIRIQQKTLETVTA